MIATTEGKKSVKNDVHNLMVGRGVEPHLKHMHCIDDKNFVNENYSL